MQKKKVSNTKTIYDKSFSKSSDKDQQYSELSHVFENCKNFQIKAADQLDATLLRLQLFVFFRTH